MKRHNFTAGTEIEVHCNNTHHNGVISVYTESKESYIAFTQGEGCLMFENTPAEFFNHETVDKYSCIILREMVGDTEMVRFIKLDKKCDEFFINIFFEENKPCFSCFGFTTSLNPK